MLQMLLFLVIGTLIAGGLCDEPRTFVTVSTPRGDLQGFHVDYGDDKTQLYYGKGDVFLGIPYAMPPVGEMRFQKTKALCQYPGASPYNATFYRPACPQLDECEGVPMSEDCLFLNVYSPNVNSVYKYPVLLWIHGGSMKGGCTQQYPHKGAIRNLVSRGVVVVVFQYRLGVPGFFTTFTDDFPPNRAMLDQVEAIRWVSDNIQYFGGDPFRITLFGESAGGASVSAHTYSPLSQNLFQQAIMESGVVLTSFEGTLGFTNLSETRAYQLCNYTDTMWKSNDFKALKECMYAVTPEQWLPLESSNILGWQMAQDNYFMPDVPRKLAPKRPKIPVMLGSNRDEWTMFWEYMILGGIKFDWFSKDFFEGIFEQLATFLTNREIDVLNILEKVYLPPNADENDALTWFRAGSDVFTAAGFTSLILKEVDHWMESGNEKVFLWEQTYASNIGKIMDLPVNTTWKPVVHTAEVFFVWMQEKDWFKALQSNSVVPFDYQLADWYGESWTNFAKYGVPSLDNTWKPVPARRNNLYLKIDEPSQGGFTMQNAYRYTDEVTWLRVIPSLAGTFPPEKPDYNNGTSSFYEPSNVDYNCHTTTVAEPATMPQTTPVVTTTTQDPTISSPSGVITTTDRGGSTSSQANVLLLFLLLLSHLVFYRTC